MIMPYFNTVVEAFFLKDPLNELIIGNVSGASAPGCDLVREDGSSDLYND